MQELGTHNVVMERGFTFSVSTFPTSFVFFLKLGQIGGTNMNEVFDDLWVLEPPMDETGSPIAQGTWNWVKPDVSGLIPPV